MSTLQNALIGVALAVLSANASALDISNTRTFNQLLVSPTPGVHDRLDFQFDFSADWNPAWTVGDISAISFSFVFFDDSASDGRETGIVTAGGDGIVCSAPDCQQLGLGFIIDSQPMIVSRIAEGDVLTGLAGQLVASDGKVWAAAESHIGDFIFNQAVITVTAVPEPETYAMLLAGLGLVGFMAARCRKAA